MVALIFSIIGFLACVFLIYVLAQFHRELAKARAPRRLHTPRAVTVITVMPVKRPADIARVWDKRAPDARFAPRHSPALMKSL
jgi:hypothetical protein